MGLTTRMGVAALAVLAACDSASAGNGGGNGNDQPDPVDVEPSAVEVLALSDDSTFEFMPGAPLAEREWDVEIQYATRDVGAVFDFYGAALVAEGFTRTGIERGDDEVEADYANDATGLTVELEAELDDGWVQVDMDTDVFLVPFPTGFTLTEFAGFETPIYPGADVREGVYLELEVDDEGEVEIDVNKLRFYGN